LIQGSARDDRCVKHCRHSWVVVKQYKLAGW
jgi:hypothetical protein